MSPRAGLTQERVVALAVDLIDTEGLDALSLSTIAHRVGVAVPSLYKHVASLADLRTLVALACLTDYEELVDAALDGRSGPEAVRSLARAIRGFALEHPGRYLAVQLAPALGEPAQSRSDASLVPIMTALAPFAIPAPHLIDVMRVLRSGIHGFVDLELHGGFALDASLDASFETLIDWLIAHLDRTHPDQPHVDQAHPDQTHPNEKGQLS